MKNFFITIYKNLIECFYLKNLKWHLLMIAITYVLVMSGFDWWYFVSFKTQVLNPLISPAIFIGGVLPILLPVILFIIGKVFKNIKTLNTSLALAQAGIIGSVISSFYKALTGRIPPVGLLNTNTLTDISHQFQFGFLRDGIFWGWPSSHTTISFAIAFTLIKMYSRNNWIIYSAFIYAIYVGIGVSVSIHWFSEVISGVILGIVIGVIVGNSFKNKI